MTFDSDEGESDTVFVPGARSTVILEGLEDQGPLSVLGIAVNSLF